MLTVSSLSFKAVLRLHEVDGHNKGGPIVRYDLLDERFLATRSGVYLITRNGVIVYCGKFTNTFAKRWLYTKGRYVYHFKRSIISSAIAESDHIMVHAQAENVLRDQLGHAGNEWISATSIEEKLIRDLRPIWNLIGRERKADSCVRRRASRGSAEKMLEILSLAPRVEPEPHARLPAPAKG